VWGINEDGYKGFVNELVQISEWFEYLQAEIVNQMWVVAFEAVQVAVCVLLARLDPPHFSDGQGLVWVLLLTREHLEFCSVDLASAMGGWWMGRAQKSECFLSVFQ
jgi:hypothetical protein